MAKIETRIEPADQFEANFLVLQIENSNDGMFDMTITPLPTQEAPGSRTYVHGERIKLRLGEDDLKELHRTIGACLLIGANYR